MLVDTKQFNVAIKNVTRAKNTDKRRPIFQNLHLFTKDNKLHIEATNGFVLHTSTINIMESEKNEPIKILEPWDWGWEVGQNG